MDVCALPLYAVSGLDLPRGYAVMSKYPLSSVQINQTTARFCEKQGKTKTSFSSKFRNKMAFGKRLYRISQQCPEGEDEISGLLWKIGSRMHSCRVRVPGGMHTGTSTRAAECAKGHRHLRDSYRCGNALCELCKHDRTRELTRRIARVSSESFDRVETGAKMLHVTLTVRHDEESSAYERRGHLQNAWHKLVSRKMWKNRVLGSSKTLEMHFSSQGPHPHFHVLAICEKHGTSEYSRDFLESLSHRELIDIAKGMWWWKSVPRYCKIRNNQTANDELIAALEQSWSALPHQVLKWEWEAVTGDSSIVYVTDKTKFYTRDTVGADGQPLEPKHAAHECAKYFAKGDTHSCTDAHLKDLVGALYRARTHSFSGLMRTVAKELGEEVEDIENMEGHELEYDPATHCECPDCGDVTPVIEVRNPIQFMAGEDADFPDIPDKKHCLRGPPRGSPEWYCQHYGVLGRPDDVGGLFAERGGKYIHVGDGEVRNIPEVNAKLSMSKRSIALWEHKLEKAGIDC